MKEIIIIAGPNGSGKTTLAGQLNLTGLFINADMYEKEFFSHIKSKEARELQSSIAVARKIKDCLQNGESFAFETVFAADGIPDFLQKAKKKGYEIKTHFVATDNSAINISRVAKRVSEGGHNVSKRKIVGRYKKVLCVLPELLKFSDKIILYDNSQEKMRPFLIKEEGQIKIIDNVPKWAKGLLL